MAAVLRPFLKMGLINANLKCSGQIPSENILLIMVTRVLAIIFEMFFRLVVVNPSIPGDLLFF